MAVVYVSGFGDDLIEVEGDVSAEFLPLDKGEKVGGYLAFSDGSILSIEYDGVWRIFAEIIADDSQYLKEYEAIEGDEAAYSDVVRLSNSYGIKWVALAKEYSATRKGLPMFEKPDLT
jgi:hypothetical protein